MLTTTPPGPGSAPDPAPDPTSGATLVDLWLIRTDRPGAARRAALHGLLDADERRRALGARHPLGRDRYVIAHGAAREILARRTGLAPTALRWRTGPHGKPELSFPERDLTTSLTHCEHLALFAVTRGRPLGVDLERAPAQAAAERLAQRFYPPADAELVGTGSGAADRFARLWTRKEAYVKAFGGRLAEGLRQPMPGDGPLVLPGPDRACRITDLPRLGPYRAALALAGTAPYLVRLHDWAAEPQAKFNSEVVVDR
ncbi:4'-phosphopantetheinyl transferase superfamily protein [Kitasatospora sp. NBC_01287]|uniref:4'-phosphopantetheinyl transferase family protein n=1 Tax=Kitasatospora sp. NBC_01287 TaxID=2903573 RepID=UPI00224E6B27|nr:4'-phosphopantetheinyl transferase superfamily protein [Kitasatospora sp. NBC_01287]MCX4744500.1 4'-phosphopantetheinyl transferase superfamily protein [Kitasatospora sp. NBC_01287]